MSQGGVIGRPNVPTFARASGLWRVGEVLNARTTDTWPFPLKIGRPAFGGFFAGIMDTTQPGAILAEDQYQTPLRYALIVSPRSLEASLPWRDEAGTVVEAPTRWNGLAAQEALTPDTTFPAFDYCNSLAFPNDGASKWYLPALDELTEAYWNLKPTTGDNTTGVRTTGDFPTNDFNRGELFSSDPQRPPFTAGTPEQTDVTDFQEGGGQDFTATGHLSASSSLSDRAWAKSFASGFMFPSFHTNLGRVRPFRRFVLPS